MDTKIFKTDEEGLTGAAQVIKDGGTVVFPTETVYGLGANALSESATEKIFEAKGRPSDNPLIVHISRKEDCEKIAAKIPPKAKKLMDKFWPGPLTIIMYKKDVIPDSVTAGMDSVGVRLPENETAREFIRLCGCPIAAPSANISGKPSPTNFKDVCRDMMGRAGGIIEGEPSNVGVESTIVDVTVDPPVVLRPGGITIEQLEETVGEIHAAWVLRDNGAPRAPGMKYKHYAPRAKVYILKGTQKAHIDFLNKTACFGRKRVLLCFDEELAQMSEFADCVSLGSKTNPEQVAANLFRILRSFDETDVREIFAPEIPSDGLWLAIRNRLYKAAGGSILDARKSKTVLFVCGGNTCRSPMAEGIFKMFYKNHYCVSAGLVANPGEPASENAILAMKKWKIDISAHVSTQVTMEMLKTANKTYVMTDNYMSILAGVKRVSLLSTAAKMKGDVPDPYGGTLEDYMECAKRLKKMITNLGF